MEPEDTRQGTWRGFWSLHVALGCIGHSCNKVSIDISLSFYWIIRGRLGVCNTIGFFKAFFASSGCIFKILNPFTTTQAFSLALIGRFDPVPFN